MKIKQVLEATTITNTVLVYRAVLSFKASTDSEFGFNCMRSPKWLCSRWRANVLWPVPYSAEIILETENII